tara:strand:- start:489 stop:650 length:162 start_codon:yes stop_codon:yes gene_type:complete
VGPKTSKAAFNNTVESSPPEYATQKQLSDCISTEAAASVTKAYTDLFSFDTKI